MFPQIASPLRFQPSPFLREGHLQTMGGELLKKSRRPRQAPQRSLLTLDDGDQLSLITYIGSKGKVVLIGHGLTGSAEAPYLLRLSAILNEDYGYTVVCFNHRNCGDGFGKARNLYHSGRSRDIAQIIAHLRHRFPEQSVLAIGFSMSGNALLKLVGDHEAGGGREFSYPDFAIAVNAPINLARSSFLINKGLNKIYQAHFLTNLNQLIKKKHQLGLIGIKPKLFSWSESLYQFDDRVTAPLGGFGDAKEYYRRSSALEYLSAIQMPTVLLTAKDDPFVDYRDYLGADQNPFIRLHIENNGGHMGYINRKTLPTGDVRWMDYAVSFYAHQLLKD